QFILSRLPGQLAQIRQQSLCLSIKVYKDPCPPFPNRDRLKAKPRMIEACRAVHLRRVQQSPVERIGPAMIATAKHFSRSASLGWGTGAMPAYVVEATQNTVGAARE